MINSQWEYYNSTLLQKSFALVGDGQGGYSCRGVSFNGSYYGGPELEWTVLLSDYYNNVIYQDNFYHDWGHVLNLSLPEVTTNTDGIIYRCTIYVKRKDGSYIYTSDMQPSVFTWYLNRTVEVPDNTMPAEWLQSTAATTTSPFSTMTTIASDLIPDDQMIEQNLTTPPWIEGAVAQILALVSQLIQLRYIRFILGFVIIVSLVAWFLH